MLMNSDELMISINKRLQESGIIDDLTDFFHEHPEYFTESTLNERNIISYCDISIAMCCKPSERQGDGVFICSCLGASGAAQVLLSDHSRRTGTKVKLTRNINREEVSSYVLD